MKSIWKRTYLIKWSIVRDKCLYCRKKIFAQVTFAYLHNFPQFPLYKKLVAAWGTSFSSSWILWCEWEGTDIRALWQGWTTRRSRASWLRGNNRTSSLFSASGAAISCLPAWINVSAWEDSASTLQLHLSHLHLRNCVFSWQEYVISHANDMI